MELNVGKELAALRRMTIDELRAKHLEAYGEPTRSPLARCPAGRWP